MELPKLSNKELSFAWELPYYFDQNGYLIVSGLDPQLVGMKDGDYWYEHPTNSHDIRMMIITEQRDAGWCPALDLCNYQKSYPKL
jgi:hypothetical protein